MSRNARVANSALAPYHGRRDALQLEVYRRDGDALKLGMQGALANTIIRPRQTESFATHEELKAFLDWLEEFRKRRHGKPTSEEDLERDMPDNIRSNRP